MRLNAARSASLHVRRPTAVDHAVYAKDTPQLGLYTALSRTPCLALRRRDKCGITRVLPPRLSDQASTD